MLGLIGAGMGFLGQLQQRRDNRRVSERNEENRLAFNASERAYANKQNEKAYRRARAGEERAWNRSKRMQDRTNRFTRAEREAAQSYATRERANAQRWNRAERERAQADNDRYARDFARDQFQILREGAEAAGFNPLSGLGVGAQAPGGMGAASMSGASPTYAPGAPGQVPTPVSAPLISAQMLAPAEEAAGSVMFDQVARGLAALNTQREMEQRQANVDNAGGAQQIVNKTVLQGAARSAPLASAPSAGGSGNTSGTDRNLNGWGINVGADPRTDWSIGNAYREAADNAERNDGEVVVNSVNDPIAGGYAVGQYDRNGNERPVENEAVLNVPQFMETQSMLFPNQTYNVLNTEGPLEDAAGILNLGVMGVQEVRMADKAFRQWAAGMDTKIADHWNTKFSQPSLGSVGRTETRNITTQNQGDAPPSRGSSVRRKKRNKGAN